MEYGIFETLKVVLDDWVVLFLLYEILLDVSF